MGILNILSSSLVRPGLLPTSGPDRTADLSAANFWHVHTQTNFYADSSDREFQKYLN